MGTLRNHTSRRGGIQTLERLGIQGIVMAGGDKIKLKVACPKCAQKGMLRILEHGRGNSLNRYKEIIEIIEGDFRDSGQGRGDVNDVFCNVCDTRFPP
jgi:hypothetical protein